MTGLVFRRSRASVLRRLPDPLEIARLRELDAEKRLADHPGERLYGVALGARRYEVEQILASRIDRR